MGNRVIWGNGSGESNSFLSTRFIGRTTFDDFLALVDFGCLFFEEFIALLTYFQDIRVGDTEFFNFGEDFLTDICGCFEFCQGVGIG
jgi:hypothetical protein